MVQTEDAKHRLREICRLAARVFYEKSYDGASMQEIAQAAGLTKAGLYHYVGSKDQLLYEIMNMGMDLVDELVIERVKGVEDAREKLRQAILGHIDLIVRARDHETTVILHENRSLKGHLLKKINARKKAYIHFLENLIAEVQKQSGRPPLVSPLMAAFFVLGIVNWLYQWYRPEGRVKHPELEQIIVDFCFRGILGPNGPKA